MFGRKNKTQTKIEELEVRIVSLAEKVAQNNDDIAELRGEVNRLSELDGFPLMDAIHARVQGLETRQQALRDALSEATRTDA